MITQYASRSIGGFDDAARNHVEGARVARDTIARYPKIMGALYDAELREAGRLYDKHLTPTGVDLPANDNVPAPARLTLADLPRDKLIYLGSPYTLYPNGPHEAARHASRAAAALMARGFVVFAPISHGHAISCLSDDLPDSWEFWKAQCQPFIDAAAALVVLKIDGWKESVGLNYEIDCFWGAYKPVVYVTPEELALREETIEAEWKRRVG